MIYLLYNIGDEGLKYLSQGNFPELKNIPFYNMIKYIKELDINRKPIFLI